MKPKELREKPIEDLNVIFKELKEKLRNLRFDLVAGKVKNVRQIRLLKKDIARVLTMINNFNKYEGKK